MSDLNEIGKDAYACIAEMIAALDCDYDRLDELKDSESLTDDEKEELAELENDCERRDGAIERILDDALSVQVRSGWAPVGDCLQAEEFMIVIATGCPAVRIRGELDGYRQPTRAWLEVQDWGTPWTRYYDGLQDVLLAYAQCFYFGE